MLVCDVLLGYDFDFHRLVSRKFHIPKKSANARQNQKKKRDKVYGVQNIERKIGVDDFHNKFDKHQNIHRHKGTYI